MPITQERQTIQDLRAVGFTVDQATMLAEKLEASAQAVAQDIKTFIVAELDKRFAQVDARFALMEASMEGRFAQMEAGLAKMEARIERSMRIQLATILSAFVGVTGLAVAILKLFPPH